MTDEWGEQTVACRLVQYCQRLVFAADKIPRPALVEAVRPPVAEVRLNLYFKCSSAAAAASKVDELKSFRPPKATERRPKLASTAATTCTCACDNVELSQEYTQLKRLDCQLLLLSPNEMF